MIHPEFLKYFENGITIKPITNGYEVHIHNYMKPFTIKNIDELTIENIEMMKKHFDNKNKEYLKFILQDQYYLLFPDEIN